LSLAICISCGGRQVKYDRYLWDGENEIGVVDESGVIQELRILGEGLGAEIGAAVLYEIKGKTYVPLHDVKGSIVTLIDLESKKPVECRTFCRLRAPSGKTQLLINLR
jgi:hypothetical protein